MSEKSTPFSMSRGAATPVTAPVSLSPTNEEFLRRIAAAAIVSAEHLGWPAHMAAVIIAQACLESSWGRSKLAIEANNLFGVKAREGEPFWEGETTEFENGVKLKKVQKFARYASWGNSLVAHAALLRKPRYARVLAACEPSAACEALPACGYATDPAYADKLKNMIRRYRFDDPARLAAWSGYPVKPTGTTPSSEVNA